MPKAANPYCRCLFYSANALARNITRMTEESFARTGLAPSLGFVVMTVQRNPGIQPSEVARIMMLSASTLTRLVEKLESKGLLRKESKGKAIHIHLTETGESLTPALKEAWQETHRRYTDLLGKDAANQLAAQSYEAALALEAQ
jgi:DNA-binding MarR family transcriptional regulator